MSPPRGVAPGSVSIGSRSKASSDWRRVGSSGSSLCRSSEPSWERRHERIHGHGREGCATGTGRPKKLLRMREELLAHLTAIYEEELARLEDETAARAEAIQRFGDPETLTLELQQSVEWRDRMDARLN